jgi:hypothetical protein
LYFRSGSRLSFEPPQEDSATAFDSYLSDPAHPVPYRHRPVEETYGPGSHWCTWLVEDQRFVYLRPDTFAWETEPLDRDTTVTGDIVAHLFAATTGSDSDWAVKLIDVYPKQYQQDSAMSGYQLMVADEILRGRFRQNFEHPEPVTPNEVTAFTIDLHTNNHTFLKGHCIMVEVQSTWFPLYDRNPQKFVPNIFEAQASDYQKATQRIYRSRQFVSYIDLPIAQP